MSAKRYDMEYVGRAYMEERQMVEREDGEWVRWEDYEALRSRNAELEAVVSTLDGDCQHCRELGEEVVQLKEDIAHRDRCDDDHLAGIAARLDGEPCDESKSIHWVLGWEEQDRELRLAAWEPVVRAAKKLEMVQNETTWAISRYVDAVVQASEQVAEEHQLEVKL